MSPSVIDPIHLAIARTKQILFDPFDLQKWLGLGFCAFLMGLSQVLNGGGGGNSTNVNGGGGGRPEFEPIQKWIRENFMTVVVVSVILAVVLLLIGTLLIWLSSRGRFMFLDGVVHNRGAVVAPWHEFRREGNSLFLFQFFLGLCGLFVVSFLLGLCLLIAWPDIQGQMMGNYAICAIAIGVLFFPSFILLMLIVSVCLTDFVVPIMYLRRITVMPAWSEFLSSLLPGYTWTFVCYLFMRFIINLVTGTLAMMTICLTCCVALLPYISSVILLPFTVFLQAYSLYFIEQFGPPWRVFPRYEPTAVPSGDLQDPLIPNTDSTSW